MDRSAMHVVGRSRCHPFQNTHVFNVWPELLYSHTMTHARADGMDGFGYNRHPIHISARTALQMS